MKTYAEYIAYFRNLAAEHTLLRDFVVGNSERILNRTLTEVRYPCLWVEDPEIAFEQGDLSGTFFEGAFVVLMPAATGEWQEEDYALERCFLIARDIVRKLRSDADAGVFEVIGRISLDRVHTLTSDADWGWRATYQLRVEDSFCLDACLFDAACPAGAMAAFSFSNDTPGTFDGLYIENESQPDAGWHYLWRWKLDEQPEQSSTGAAPEIEGEYRWLYLRLTATKGACTREASAFFSSSDACGRSVPYCYNPARFYPGWNALGLAWTDTEGIWTDTDNHYSDSQ